MLRTLHTRVLPHAGVRPTAFFRDQLGQQCMSVPAWETTQQHHIYTC